TTAHPAPHPRHRLCPPKVYRHIDKETVSNATEQRAVQRVKASSSPGRCPHLISPGIAGEEEFRCHLDSGAEPGKGTTKTASELVVFSDCLACCAAASSMSCCRTSWSALST